MKKETSPFVSLIIPTYMREDLLVQTLECAINQEYTNYEIIVIDQTPAHSQNTIDFLHSVRRKIKLIPSSPPSVTAARNTGVRAARGEIIVFIDDDTSFSSDFLQNHVENYKKKCDFVQGRIIEKGCKDYPKPVWLSRLGNFSGSDFCTRDGITNNITGCNFSFRRSMFDALGGFDEFFQGIAVCEDSDFAYRAYKKGFKGCFSSRAVLTHHRSDTGGVGHGIENQYFDLGFYRNKLYFYRKNFSYPVYIYQKIRFFGKGIRRFIRLFRQAAREANKP